MVSAELVARERQAIRDAAEAVLTGVSMCEVARQWNAAGLRTAAGREWVQVAVRDTLKRPSLAGVIEHEGKPVGRLPGKPILPQHTFERVRAFIAGRKRGRVPGVRYVGPGLIRCGRCFRTLSAHAQTGKTYADGAQRFDYFCSKQHRGCGGVYADGRSVDVELRKFTISRMSDSRHAAAIAAARARVADRLAAVNDEIAEIKQLHEALSARLGLRQMTLDAFDIANEPLVADLARLKAECEALSGDNPDGPTQAQSPEEVGRQWDDGKVADRRSLLTQALGRDWMLVEPFTQSGKKRFNPRRVRVVKPKSAAEVAEYLGDASRQASP